MRDIHYVVSWVWQLNFHSLTFRRHPPRVELLPAEALAHRREASVWFERCALPNIELPNFCVIVPFSRHEFCWQGMRF